MRSALLIPPGDPAAFQAGLSSGADALIADVAAAGRAPPAGAPALFVRLRPLDAAQSLDEIEAAARLRPTGVVLSAAGGADVQRLGARLAVAEARLGLAEGAIKILAFVTETPQAVLGLASYRGASARLAGLIVSTGPLGAALRAAPAGRPARLARDLALIAARAAGVLALDEPFDGPAGLEAAARVARDDGFDGMAALSPSQVPTLNATFEL